MSFWLVAAAIGAKERDMVEICGWCVASFLVVLMGVYICVKMCVCMCM